MSKEPRKPGLSKARAPGEAAKAVASRARKPVAKAGRGATAKSASATKTSASKTKLSKPAKPTEGKSPPMARPRTAKKSATAAAGAKAEPKSEPVVSNAEAEPVESVEAGGAVPLEPEVLPLETLEGEGSEIAPVADAEIVSGESDDESEPVAAEPVDADGDSPAEELGDLTDLARSNRPAPRAAGTDLSRADALSRYLAEIVRHPLLTREEEHELAAKFKETQNPQLAYRLVTANLRLVVKIAMEFRRAAFNVLDLIQEGNVGLMQAVQKYDPHRGVKLSSYAAWWIRAYILRYLMDNWRMVKLGTTQAQRKLFFNLRKEQEKLLSQGFEAAPKLLAEKLDVSEQDIREMDQRLGNDQLSIDAPVSSSDESRQTYGDRLSEGHRGAEEELGDEELKRVFRDNLARFGETLTNEKDRFLFDNRIAVPEGKEPLTLQQVGEKYGFTRERARQIEARLTDRLREFLRERMPDFAQLSFNEPKPEQE